MRLVEDDRVVLRQDARAVVAAAVARSPQRHVGEVERVVRDHQLGLARTLPRGLSEAHLHEWTAAAGAAVGSDRELRPERFRRLDRELRPVARLRLVEPRSELVELRCVGLVAQQLAAEQAESLERLPADVVLAALEHRDPDLAPERRGGHRDVLRQQLLLQRLRRGRDDDPLPRLERGYEVGETLSCPGSRLGQKVVAAVERACDGARERGLLGPRLVAGEDALERPSRAEDLPHCPERTRPNGRSPSAPAVKNVAASELLP